MDILSIRELLLSGAVMLYETDTIVGLGCDARSEKGIDRINQIKHRPSHKSYIVLVSDLKMLEDIVGPISKQLLNVMQNVERPTTFIFPKYRNLPLALSGHGESLAIRWTQNKVLQKFIDAIGFPLVSTSANISGIDSPQRLKEVDTIIHQEVDFTLPLSFDGTLQASRIVKISEEGRLITLRD